MSDDGGEPGKLEYTAIDLTGGAVSEGGGFVDDKWVRGVSKWSARLSVVAAGVSAFSGLVSFLGESTNSATFAAVCAVTASAASLVVAALQDDMCRKVSKSDSFVDRVSDSGGEANQGQGR